MRNTMNQLVNEILSQRDREVREGSVPTRREVALAKCLELLSCDLDPNDPRALVVNELCEDVCTVAV